MEATVGYNTKNYMTHNGEELHIGGRLIIDEGGSIEGLPLCTNQKDSEATTVAGLKDDLNSLIAKLKESGLMAGDEE